MIATMSAVLLAMVLVATLLALIPVWRLHGAGWPPRWLLVAWTGYAIAIFLAMRAPLATRFLIPILVLAYVAPFVAGPERLSRVARRPTEPRPVINVTPRPPSAIAPPDDSAVDAADEAAADGDPDGDADGGDR